jgi:hypothetical protein
MHYPPPLGNSNGVHAGNLEVGMAADAVVSPHSAITGARSQGYTTSYCLT